MFCPLIVCLPRGLLRVIVISCLVWMCYRDDEAVSQESLISNISFCFQLRPAALQVALSVSGSTKTPHSLAATLFTLEGWNLAWRSCVCVWGCVFLSAKSKTGKKEAWQWEWPVIKRHITIKHSCNMAKLCRDAHTHTHTHIDHGLPCPYTIAPPHSITNQPFVYRLSWGACICDFMITCDASDNWHF